MTRRAPLLSVSILVLAGCGGDGFEMASVSGQVSLNGKPVPGALVSFEPQTTAKEQGPGSSAETDAEGRYSLRTIDGTRGAVVGKHRVRISTLKYKKERSDAAVPRADEILAPEVIPERYATEPLTFDVPIGGTSAANFTLEGPPPRPFSDAVMKGRPRAP